MTKAETQRGKRARRKFAPAPPAQEQIKKGTRPRDWRGVFLAALAETSNVSRSAEVAGVSPSRAYQVRRRESGFERAWFAALCEGYDHLEMEVLRRLREGDFAAEEGGKYDFGAAVRILSAHRETVGRHRARMEDQDEEAILASIDATLDKILEREEAMKDLLAEESAAQPSAADE